jgi:ectoine hydroxylase-related dioxygenase (phytanoyl-CoA dioxygenase family)
MTTTTTAASDEVTSNLQRLEHDGFLLVRGALDLPTVEAWRSYLYGRYQRKEYDGLNSVGNCYIENLLKDKPETARALVGHASVAPYLRAALGRQCQLRSVRAHLNPGAYTQEWHMDFTDYWDQESRAGGLQPLRALCMNTTFYLTDNTPERGRLTFLTGYHRRRVPLELQPHTGYTTDRSNPFQSWCDRQEKTDLHPMAGDAVVFFSHIPHQGAKVADPPDAIRGNIVLHYQQNPMFPGIKFVSTPQFTLEALGYDGTFPFARG